MVACRPAPVRGLHCQRVRGDSAGATTAGPRGRQESAAMQAPMGRRSPPRWRVRNACTAMPSSNLVRLLRARYPTDVQGHRRRDVGRWLLRRHVRGERAPYGCPPNRPEGRRAVHRGRLSGSPTEGAPLPDAATCSSTLEPIVGSGDPLPFHPARAGRAPRDSGPVGRRRDPVGRLPRRPVRPWTGRRHRASGDRPSPTVRRP